jgi:two-component system, sensor histidine kinase LadS
MNARRPLRHGFGGALTALACLVLPAAAQPALVLDGTEQARELTGHLAQLEDAAGRLDLRAARALAWTPEPRGTVSYGFSNSVWWLRLRLDNPDARPVNTVLDLNQPSQDLVDWTVLDARGQVLQQARSGDRLPFAQRPLSYRGLALPITVPAQSQVEVVLRLDTHDGLFEAMRPTLSSPAAFAAAADRTSLLQGLYFGVVLALAGYNLFMYVTLRKPRLALYVGYLVSFMVWGATIRGFGLQFLWPDSPVFNNEVRVAATAVAASFALLFFMSYLRLRERAPGWVLRGGQALATGCLLIAALAWLDLQASLMKLMMPLLAVAAGSILVVAVWQWGRGSREARYYVLAFLPLVVGVLLNVLQVVAIIPAHSVAQSIWQVAVLFEMVVLAIGLADSVYRMKAEKLEAERAARQAQETLATRLEAQVQERTLALEQANRKLYTMAIVDELTGAYNRRHFNEMCAATLAAPHRGEPLVLCMLDIDHFKGFNDHYGHQAGDRALAAVAQALRVELKRADDHFFRLGGEEFGILMSARTAAGAERFIEGLRQVVHRLALPHLGNPGGVVSVSFGAMWWGAPALKGLTPEAMYAAADRQLYRAKAEGRDCVVLGVASSEWSLETVTPLETAPA